MRIIKPNKPPAVVLWIFSIGIFCFEHKEIVLWKMGLNFFFCIKVFRDLRNYNTITEWYTNFFKLLLGFILVKSLQYWINSCQFIVICFDKLHNILAVFFWPHSFIFFILSFFIASFLGDSLCINRYSWLYAESLILSFPNKSRFRFRF